MTRKLRVLLVLALLAFGVLGAALIPGARSASADCPFCGPTEVVFPTPDLKVTDITAQWSQGQIVIQFWVKNAGVAPAKNFWTKLQVTPNYPDKFVFEDYLAAGATTVYTITVSDPPGNFFHYVTVTADSTQVVNESDNSNNSRTETFWW